MVLPVIKNEFNVYEILNIALEYQIIINRKLEELENSKEVKFFAQTKLSETQKFISCHISTISTSNDVKFLSDECVSLYQTLKDLRVYLLSLK